MTLLVSTSIGFFIELFSIVVFVTMSSVLSEIEDCSSNGDETGLVTSAIE
jgi:hypothetical protein